MFFKILAISMLLYTLVTFYRTREVWRVTMVVSWILLLFYNFMPRWLAIMLLSITLFLTLILKYSLLADIYFFGVLRRLSTQGREAREGLTPKQIEELDTYEFISDERIPKGEIAEWLVKQERLDKELEETEIAREKAKARKKKEQEESEAAQKAEEQEMAIEQFDGVQEVRFTITEGMPNLWQSAELKLGEQVGVLRFSRPLKDTTREHDQEKVMCHLRWQDVSGKQRTADTWFIPGSEFRVKPIYATKEMFWWGDADAQWKTNFCNRCMLAYIYVEDDRRDWFWLSIGTERFIIRLKYMSYHVDVALSANGQRFCVRVRGMLHREYEGDPLSEDPKVAEAAKFTGNEQLAPFCFEIPVEQVLPITAPYRHTMTSDGLDSGDFLQEKMGDGPNI